VSVYVALLDGGRREEPIEVRPAGPGTYEVRLRGEVHLVDAFRHDYGTLSLIVDTASYSARLDWRGSKVKVRVGQSALPLELLDERRARTRRAAGKLTADGRQTVTAPAAGRIVRALCAVGDRVRAGQPLLVFEVMQMENELRSPRDGRVVELHVKAGEAVERGAKLCVVD
jgi:biotin carboxyl carrier protein